MVTWDIKHIVGLRGQVYATMAMPSQVGFAHPPAPPILVRIAVQVQAVLEHVDGD